MNAEQARQAAHAARITKTVDRNLDEVKAAAAAGYNFTYYKPVYNDPTVNQAAEKRLAEMGFKAGNGYVDWYK